MVLYAQRFVQGYVTRRERIGPAQGPQGDVVRGPGADAGQGLQRGHGGGHIGTGVQAELALHYRLGEGLNGFLALFDDAKLAEHVGVQCGQRGGTGEKAADAGKEAGWQCVLRR